MEKKNQVLMSVLGVFALVIVTVGVSYAFFSYSRTGETTSTITSGDISFTYTEGAEATLENAFPVADAIGAVDNKGVYTFTVKGNVTGAADLKYDITLLSSNEDADKKYFTNDQIKVNLLNTATGTYAIGSATEGVKLSELTAAKDTNLFAGEDKTDGSCVVLTGQDAVEAGEVYELRMWIASDVDYSNTASTTDGTDEKNDAQTSTGKFSGYTYSLKVKVDAQGTSTYTATTTQPGA